MTTTINLPYPPSTNEIWRAARHRVIRSDKYKDWLNEAGWMLKEQRPKPVKGKVSITVECQERRSDLDNLAKATIDLLVVHEIIEGDGPKHVRKITLEWSSDVKGARVTVREI